MATGANTAPLGRLHPILAARGGSEGTSPSSNTPLGSKQALNNPELRAHLEAAKRAASQLFSEEPAKKKRRSRWGAEETRTVIPGLPTVLPPNLSETQQKLYLLHLRIEDLSRRLRTDDLGIAPNPLDRSPSPEPIYSTDGKRLNTREFRARKKLEDDRHECIQAATALNPDYKPPTDYKAPLKKFEDKIFIPQEDHPQTNFVGLLIGPRGNTLKQLEKETNCKIMIRGKGATKQGKYNPLGLPQPGEDEELHALITAQSPEDLKVGMDKVGSIVQSGIDNPGNENDLKRMQMMQLAELNGTFRPLDVLKCSNCGSTTHRTWECSEGQNITSTIICTRCGGGGHVALDCKVDLATLNEQPSVADKAKMDSEYQSLMKELGEPVPETSKATATSVAAAAPPPPTRGGVSYPPPAPLLGGNNPGGVQIPDPTTAAAPWTQMMPPVHPIPGALPFPILLPQVPPPWMGMPGAVPGVVPGMVPGAVQGQMPGAVPGGQVPVAVPGAVPGPVPGSVPGPVPGMIPSNQPVASTQDSFTDPAINPPTAATSSTQQQAPQAQPMGWPPSQPVGGTSYAPPPPPIPLSNPIVPPVPLPNVGAPPPPPDQLIAPPPPPPSEPPPPPPS